MVLDFDIGCIMDICFENKGGEGIVMVVFVIRFSRRRKRCFMWNK